MKKQIEVATPENGNKSRSIISLADQAPINAKDLHIHTKNLRSITDRGLKLLGESFNEYGDLSGVVYNKKTSTLVTGNQRIKVLRNKIVSIDTKKHADEFGTIEQGLIVVETKKGKFAIPLRIVEWPLVKQTAANIAANAHGGRFELEKLAVTVQELKVKNYNLDLTGLDPLLLKELEILSKPKPPAKPKLIEISDLGLKNTCPKCNYQF